MSLFRKPSEIEVKPCIKVLVYGQPGLGKSTFALSAPNPVLFDFDGGVQRVNGAFQCPTLQVENWEQVSDALAEDLSEFDTIVIDTAGKMLDFMSAYIIKNDSKMAMRDGSLSLKGYGARKTMFINFLKRVEGLGKHIVFVAHEREDKDGDVRYIRPEIGGSSANDLIKELDLVGYMQAVGNEWTIFWTPQEKFYAKNTCNLPQCNKIPRIIDENGEIIGKNNALSMVFDSHKNYLKAQSDKTKKYEEFINRVKSVVEDIKDVTSANEIRKQLLELEQIWDSKARINRLVWEKCNNIGLKYNKIKDQYEAA